MDRANWWRGGEEGEGDRAKVLLYCHGAAYEANLGVQHERPTIELVIGRAAQLIGMDRGPYLEFDTIDRSDAVNPTIVADKGARMEYETLPDQHERQYDIVYNYNCPSSGFAGARRAVTHMTRQMRRALKRDKCALVHVECKPEAFERMEKMRVRHCRHMEDVIASELGEHLLDVVEHQGNRYHIHYRR